MKKLLGFSSLFLAAVSFGSFGLWIRILNREMTVYQQIVLRNAFAFVFAILVVFFTKQFRNIPWNKVKKLNLALYTFLVPLAVITYNFSILNTKIALTTFAFYIGTILMGWVIGAVFFKEKFDLPKWFSLILVMTGLTLFVYPFSKSSLNLGFLLGIASGAIDAAANGFRKDLSGKMSKFILVLMTTIGGVAVSGLMMRYFLQGLEYVGSMSMTSWIVGAFFGFLLVVLNYLLLVGFQNFDISLGSIVLSLELLFALLFGMIFLKEFPTTRELIGGSLILFANIVPNMNVLSKLGKLRTLNNPRKIGNE